MRTYGLKSCIVKGVRTSKKSKLKANFFQVGNILQIGYYNAPHKDIQLISDSRMAYTYTSLREDIPRNCIQMFMLEVLMNALQKDDAQEDLYDFVRAFFFYLDCRSDVPLALLPSYFVINLIKYLGYSIHNNHTAQTPFFNIWEGTFQNQMPNDPPYIDERTSEIIYQINLATDIQELIVIHTQAKQHDVLQGLLAFMEHHFPNYKQLKSPAILTSILN